MVTSPEIIHELESIAKKRGGLLCAADVVGRASNPQSSLHNWFEWDDGEAAHQYRLVQARRLIRVVVHYIDAGEDRLPMRVFVSLSSDRKEPAGGYRLTTAVLSDDTRRTELLSDALAEMRAFQSKFRSLRELAAVFSAMRAASEDVEKVIVEPSEATL